MLTTLNAGWGATAAVAFDDLLAEGLLVRLAERGVRVPEDFSIVGCDDALGPRTRPPLSTISSPAHEAGRRGVEVLADRILHPAARPLRQLLPTALIARESTATAPGPA